MLSLKFADKDFRARLASFCRSSATPPEMAVSVAAILAEVKAKGDEAVSDYAAKFDGAKLRPGDFKVALAELAAAAAKLTPQARRALAAARASIIDFNRRSLPVAWSARNRQGAR